MRSARIRRAFTADPGLAALFGSYDDSPEAEGVVSVFRNLLHHHVHQSAAGPATTFWGGIGAVRRDAFERVGGFDQERFAEPSVEDIELGMRLTAAGAHILLDPDVQGKHLKRWTLPQMIHTDFVQARDSVGRAAARVEERVSRAQPGLAPPAQHGCRTDEVLAAVAARRPRLAAASLGASSFSTTRSTRSSHGDAAGARPSPESAFTPFTI